LPAGADSGEVELVYYVASPPGIIVRLNGLSQLPTPYVDIRHLTD